MGVVAVECVQSASTGGFNAHTAKKNRLYSEQYVIFETRMHTF